MGDLRLAQLPDRTPIKLGIQITPQLHADLTRYAALYKQAYGREEALSDLIPAMLDSFLASDREFVKAQKADVGRS
ncbi:DUF2274 domain-containing protein [Sphingomonas oligophenolica]